MEMQVDEVGPSLRYATAKVNKTQRSGGGGGSWGGGQQPGGGQQSGGGQGGQGGGFGGQGQSGYNAPAGGAADDPWATGGSTSFGDEPPF